MLNLHSRRGVVLVLFTAVAFLVTVIYLVTAAATFRQQPVGTTALQILQDTSVARKVDFYVRQSLRNAAYAGLADLQHEGFFASEMGGKQCPLVQGKPLLFADVSCASTMKTLEERYLTFVRQHFTSFFSTPLYGLQLKTADFPFTLTLHKGSLTFSGATPYPLAYTGQKVTYTFPVSYKEDITYDFRHYDLLLETLRQQLPCIKRTLTEPRLTTSFILTFETDFTQTLLQYCPLSDAFTWNIERQGDLLLMTATTKDSALFLDNLSFAFAISLNNLQLSQQDTSLF